MVRPSGMRCGSMAAIAIQAFVVLSLSGEVHGARLRVAKKQAPILAAATPPPAAIPQAAAVLTTPAPAAEAQLFQQLDALGAQNGGVIEGHSNQVITEMTAMNAAAADPRVKTICETGFNGGHSDLRWLLHSQAHVYSFDIGVHPYSKPAAEWLGKLFPGRHTVTWGDSTQTIPAFHLQNPGVKCNLIFVDGGHDFPVAAADMLNFMNMADPDYNVIMLDDVYCGMSYCQGPNVAWTQMIQSGQIVQTAQQTEPGGARGFAFGHYNVAQRPPVPPAAATVPPAAAVAVPATAPPLPQQAVLPATAPPQPVVR